jgi:zinc transporter, ZIP family
VSLGHTLLLGFVAGVTILLGLPIGRMRRKAQSLRAVLNAVAIGVLVFLVWDVLGAAWQPVDSALGAVHEHTGGLAPVFGYGLLFGGGIAVGLLSLVAWEKFMGRARTPARIGPGTMAEAEAASLHARGVATWPAAKRLALLIAIGIGLHNFAEGLAIGQSAAQNEIALATLLVIGFGLHNATEGFGIVAPLASDPSATKPSWGFLLLMGLIGGGPTFVGTAVGHGFTNEAVSVAFLALAAGSILYVVAQLFWVAARTKRMDLLAYGMLLGLLAGFVTDAIVTAAGV